MTATPSSTLLPNLGVVCFFLVGERVQQQTSSTSEVDLHYMSANYQQPAKHEKSAENPILARLDLELGKPHLLDWSSGPTFF